MNYIIDNKRFWFWGFIILLILNLSIIGTVIYYSFKVKEDRQTYFNPGIRNQPPKTFLMNRLNLDEKQTEQFDEIISNHQSEIRKLKNELHKKNQNLIKEVASEEPSLSQINELKSEITVTHNEIINETINFYKETKSICTPSQIKELNIMFEEIMFRGPRSDRAHRHHRMRNRRGNNIN